MNTATIRRFLILLSSKWEANRVGLYQLVSLAEHCYSLNDIETLREFSTVLQRFPYHFSQVGKYYQAICSLRQGEFEKATTLLENVAEIGPDRYRAKALLSLGAVEQGKGDLTSSLKFRLEACRLADPQTLLESQSGIAVIRSIDEDHQWATKHLENLMPLARSVGGPIYLKYLNTLAVELSEVGRLHEAKNISNILLASPYAFAYPEWYETNQGIAVKAYRLSRSAIFLAQTNTPQNVLCWPEREVIPSPQNKPASIHNIQDWKKKMPKKANGDQKNDKEMDDRDVFMEIMRLSSQEGMSSKKLWKMLDAIRKVSEEPDED